MCAIVNTMKPVFREPLYIIRKTQVVSQYRAPNPQMSISEKPNFEKNVVEYQWPYNALAS